MKILLDYVFPITQITPTPDASTAFLKQVLLVVKPKAGQEANVGTIYECTNFTQVQARTDNQNAEQFFDALMSKVFILLADDLAEIDAMLEAESGEFYTVVISDDFDDEDVDGIASSLVKGNLTFTAKTKGAAGDNISIAFITGGTAGSEVVTVVGNAISVSMAGGVSTAQQLKTALDAKAEAAALISTAIASGQSGTAQAAFALDNLESGHDKMDVSSFKGVVGVSSDDAEFVAAQAILPKRAAFFTKAANGATNMAFAFGSLLANLSNWLNQQYITMPENDDVDELGEANSLFDDKASFVIHDDEFGNRLALFAAGGEAIVAPYIKKNLEIDLQSRALQWISANQPQYTLKEAALLENRLQEDVINLYIQRGWLESGTVSITIDPTGNFVAEGDIVVPTPKGLWRVFSEMREAL